MSESTNQENEFIPGAWVSTKAYDFAVCLKCEDDMVHMRYQATRCVDNKEIWVYVIESKELVTFEAKPNDESMSILQLNGVYGEKPTQA